MNRDISQIAGMYFVFAAIGEMRVNRENIVGQLDNEVRRVRMGKFSYLEKPAECPIKARRELCMS